MHLAQAQFGGRVVKTIQTYGVLLQDIQSRDYRREVALLHLTAETEAYSSHHSTVILQIWLIGKINGQDSSAMHRWTSFLFDHMGLALLQKAQ